LGVPSHCACGEGYVDIPALELTDVELLGVLGDGMPGRNVQRKPGTTRGSPRRSRTAKAAHISCGAMKLCCACEWGGWGRLSVEGAGQHNPHRSEGPWSRATLVARVAVFHRADGLRLSAGDRFCRGEHEGRRQT